MALVEIRVGSYVGIYEDSLKPGDIITTYYKGYAQVTRVVQRGEFCAPLVYFKQIANENGDFIKGKVERSCDAAYCRFAADSIRAEITRLETVKEKLSFLLNFL